MSTTTVTTVVPNPVVYNTPSTGGLAIDNDGVLDLYFKFTGITNGTLAIASEPVSNGQFKDHDDVVGLDTVFTPTAGFSGVASFSVQASTTELDAGLIDNVATATIQVSLPADYNPGINDAQCAYGQETEVGDLRFGPDTDDTTPYATHFKIIAIDGGALKKQNQAAVAVNDFVPFVDDGSTLIFTPSAAVDGSVTIQASTSATAAGLGGQYATAVINVINPLAAPGSTNYIRALNSLGNCRYAWRRPGDQVVTVGGLVELEVVNAPGLTAAGFAYGETSGGNAVDCSGNSRVDNEAIGSATARSVNIPATTMATIFALGDFSLVWYAKRAPATDPTDMIREGYGGCTTGFQQGIGLLQTASSLAANTNVICATILGTNVFGVSNNVTTAAAHQNGSVHQYGIAVKNSGGTRTIRTIFDGAVSAGTTFAAADVPTSIPAFAFGCWPLSGASPKRAWPCKQIIQYISVHNAVLTSAEAAILLGAMNGTTIFPGGSTATKSRHYVSARASGIM